ncbi:MAG: flavodoxin domain-containing protein [Pseudomonadota bacterium]
MSVELHILYATISGTAEYLAKDMRNAVPDVSCQISNIGDVAAADLTGDPLYVIVSSTYGSGDMPDDAEDFAGTLGAVADLNHVKFAVFGLGDRTFGETFNQGSEKIMTALQQKGATLVGERGIFDASGFDMPEDVGVPWLQKIVADCAVA